MSFFKNITSLDALKTAYRLLALKNHPDCGGDENTMKDINAEYDILFSKFKYFSKTEENASDFRNEFYTENGWMGENYDVYLSNKDIAKLVRKFVKTSFPKCKFSITSDFNHISIRLLKADFNPFGDECHNDYEQLNHYAIHSENLSAYGKVMFDLILNYLNSYRFDDSDSRVDYFNTNFYIHLSIGNYDKPFIQTANNTYSAETGLIIR